MLIKLFRCLTDADEVKCKKLSPLQIFFYKQHVPRMRDLQFSSSSLYKVELCLNLNRDCWGYWDRAGNRRGTGKRTCVHTPFRSSSNRILGTILFTDFIIDVTNAVVSIIKFLFLKSTVQFKITVFLNNVVILKLTSLGLEPLNLKMNIGYLHCLSKNASVFQSNDFRNSFQRIWNLIDRKISDI